VDNKAGVGVVCNYAIYAISNNTAGNLVSVYVSMSDLVGTNLIRLADTDNGLRQLGALAPGQTKLAAFYLQGPGFTGNSDTLLDVTNVYHSVKVYNGPPPTGTLLVSSNYSFTNIIFATQASANKVTLITNLNPVAVLGSDVKVIIAGESGVIGGEQGFALSPGVLSSWRPDAYQLVRSEVHFVENPDYTNQFHFDPSVPGFTNFSGQRYTNSFTYRAVKVTGTNLPISPFVFVDSGSGTKHTDIDSLTLSGGSNVVYSATNQVYMTSHAVTPTSMLAPGGVVTYSVSFTNVSLIPLELDEIVDTLPGSPDNVAYVPGSAMYNGVPLVDPGITGQTLRWALPLNIDANGSCTLTFQAVAPLAAGDYTNRIVGVIGNEQIDLSIDTTDNAPGVSIFTIIPVSDLGITKAGPATVHAATNFDYILTVTNAGPSPAAGFVVADPLPVNVAFVAASDGGVLQGGTVVWSNLSLSAGNVMPLTVTVTAPPDAASLTNSASVTGSNLDLNGTNDVAPPVVTTVTPVADVAIVKTAPSVVANGANFNYTLMVTNLGPSEAASVSVADALPDNVTFVGASDGGVLNAGDVVWTSLGNLPAYAGLTLSVTVTAPAGGGITNTASVTGSTLDLDPGNNTTPPVISMVGNVPPTAVDDYAATTRDATASVDVLANDSDANGDPLTLIDVTQTNGTAVINGVHVDYTPATNFLGDAVMTYTVIDGQGGTNTALLIVSVTNRPPVAVNDLALVTNGVPRVLEPLGNDSDPDGDALTLVNAVASNGTVSINPGGTNLTFTATNSFSGTITYTVSDGYGGFDTATINVVGNNIAPTAFDQGVVIPEDTSTNLIYSATDDGTNLLFAILSTPTNGLLTAFDPNAGTVTYTPYTNYVGPDAFAFTVFDGDLYATGLVSLTVTPLNDAPVADDLVILLPEDTSTNLVVTGSDVDSTNLVFGILSGPANGVLGVLNTNSGAVTYTPASDYVGLDGFTFTVFDGSLYATGTVSITVTPLNDAPVAVDDFGSTSEDVGLSIPVLANDSDPDGDLLSLVGVSTTNGTALVVGTNVYYMPATNFHGTNVMSYSVTDGLLTNTAMIVVAVNPVNDAPVADDLVILLPEDTSTNLVVTGSDVDSTNLVFGILSGPTNGTLSGFDSDTGMVTYRPGTNYVGPDAFEFTVFDGELSATGLVSFTIMPVNDSPIASNLVVTLPEDTLTNLVVTGSDVDSTNLTYAILSAPANGSLLTFSAATGAAAYLPATNYVGTDGFTFTVSDGALLATGSVSLTIVPVNDVPVGIDDSYLVMKNTQLNVPATGVLSNDIDPDGDLLAAILAASPSNGVLNLNGDGSFVYTPATNYVGMDGFTYRATDGISTSLVVTVTFNVLNTNLPPVAVDDSFATLQTVPLVVAAPGVLTNDTDPDGDSLTALLVAGPQHGTLNFAADGGFVYTPTNDYAGPDSFTYRAGDGLLTSAPATVSLTVLPAADVAVAKSGPAEVAPGATFSYTISLTNLGPSVASNLVVVDLLPAEVAFVGASGGGSLSNASVIWPVLPALGRDAVTNLTITVTAPTNGVFTNTVLGAASTTDPNPDNNNGSAVSARVITVVLPTLFGISSGTNVFNPQTGLYEQTVVITNITGITVAAVRLLVGDFATPGGIPRSDVWLWNATGTNVDGRRYVQYNAPLDPGQFVPLRLEFYNPTRQPFTNSLEAEAVLPAPATTNISGGVDIDVAFTDNREPGSPRFVIEWTSIPGRSYTVIYSDDKMVTWQAATPSVIAGATRTQWYDDGPPKTASPPLGVGSRFYRVILNP